MFLALELCLTAIAVAIAYTYPQLGERWFDGIERSLAGLANRQLLAAVTIGLLAIGLRLALLPILPIPVPEVHDEYSHLLLADTLAHGRLANPTHPMWIHFETFHVNWHPTYASMYYPGHALFLAFGQVVLGNPFWGVLLSSGLMCAAICWALQGWMPPGWALLGAFLAVIRLGTFSYWANSYWGGTVSALGGALVLGALPRIKNHQRPRDGFFLGLGMAILAITRPYEGIFFCLPISIVLLVWAGRQKIIPLTTLIARIGVPAVLTLAVGLVWLGFYFWRVTGSPFTTPYQVNIRTYGLVYFPWEKIKPVPQFHHAAMQMFYRGHSVLGLFSFARQHNILLQLLKAVVIWLFYFGPLLSMPWILWLMTRPRGKFCKSVGTELPVLLLLCLATYISIALTIYVGQPHYAGPMTAALYVATLLIMRDLYLTPAGRPLTRSVPLIALVLFFSRAASPAVRHDSSWVRIWCTADWQNLERSRVLRQLEHTPGEHLVIVRYRTDHDFVLDEWVFNDADIDNSKVVWARDMGRQNTELLQYFRHRKVWLAEPDQHPVELKPYAD
jgi:hypothetical protein